jgi:2-deoxy-D-gluconate 3-dehydrogenase
MWTHSVFIITGAASGIGRELAIQAAQQGADVIALDVNAEGLAEIRSHSEKIRTRILDVGKADEIRAFADQTIPKLEGRKLVLVNNAGVSWGAPIEEFPEIGWDKVMDTNVKGVFFLTQKLLPLLQARASKDNTSRIVNIGSIDGIGTPSFETYSYGPSKAAVHSLTKVLAGRLASRHIIVNAIAPGPFPTWMLSTGVGGGGDVDNTDWETVGRMNPSGRVGTPEDIAGLALYLCSRAGAFTVGEVITCDGGSLLR